MKQIVIVGDVLTGLLFFGPFDDYFIALAWADAQYFDDYLITYMEEPDA